MTHIGATREEDIPQQEDLQGKVFEEVIRKNVTTIVDYTKRTREMFREIEVKFGQLEATVAGKDETIAQLKLQISSLQSKVFAGGT